MAFPRVLPQLRATMLLQWVLERLPQVNVLLCSESRLFFLSPQDLADPDFLATHQPCTFTGLEAALCYPWLKLLFAAPRPILERLEGWAVDHSILEVMDRVYTSPTYLEFLPRGVHKGRCLRDLRCLDVLRGRPDGCRRRLYQRPGAIGRGRHLRGRGQRPAGGPGRRRLSHRLPG